MANNSTMYCDNNIAIQSQWDYKFYGFFILKASEASNSVIKTCKLWEFKWEFTIIQTFNKNTRNDKILTLQIK